MNNDIDTWGDELPARDVNDDPLPHPVDWDEEDEELAVVTSNPNSRPVTPQAKAALKVLHAQAEREWNRGTIGRRIED